MARTGSEALMHDRIDDAFKLLKGQVTAKQKGKALLRYMGKEIAGRPVPRRVLPYAAGKIPSGARVVGAAIREYVSGMEEYNNFFSVLDEAHSTAPEASWHVYNAATEAFKLIRDDPKLRPNEKYKLAKFITEHFLTPGVEDKGQNARAAVDGLAAIALSDIENTAGKNVMYLPIAPLAKALLHEDKQVSEHTYNHIAKSYDNGVLSDPVAAPLLSVALLGSSRMKKDAEAKIEAAARNPVGSGHEGVERGTKGFLEGTPIAAVFEQMGLADKLPEIQKALAIPVLQHSFEHIEASKLTFRPTAMVPTPQKRFFERAGNELHREHDVEGQQIKFITTHNAEIEYPVAGQPTPEKGVGLRITKINPDPALPNVIEEMVFNPEASKYAADHRDPVTNEFVGYGEVLQGADDIHFIDPEHVKYFKTEITHPAHGKIGEIRYRHEEVAMPGGGTQTVIKGEIKLIKGHELLLYKALRAALP